MATLSELVELTTLHRVRVSLARDQFEDREFYAFPRFWEWLNGPVRTASAFNPSDISPRMQAHAFLRHFISGQPMSVGRQFKRMRPEDRDVFELVTPDLRIFGWFPSLNKFVAVAGDFMVNTHTHDLYAGYRDLVARERGELELDEPKWIVGATENDVVSF